MTVATPNADGVVVHEVKMGQSLWSIAIAYESHIVDILRYNSLSPEQQVVWVGQKLNIPVTPQAVTATLQPSLETTSTPPSQATIVNPVVTTASVTRTVKPSPTATPTPTSAPVKAAATVNVDDQTVGYVLGGVFFLGVMLVGFGLLSRRKMDQ
ncbi:LysM peptidoglycan-binding domain-containing protein [bacterium]|nr:LysM peptidoglycan-binding domain-containing protein [bacterium]